MITAGFLTCIAIFILFIKMPITTLRRLLWLDIPIDIAVTALLMVLFEGTYSGMMAAIIGGLIFSLCLWGLKALVGYEAPRLIPQPPFIEWIEFY